MIASLKTQMFLALSTLQRYISIDMPGHYPIIYVRGFALRRDDIDETSDDPTNGFNVGTTHARQGLRQRVLKYRFPGPFVRLMTDHQYVDSIRGETDSVEDLDNPLRTLWIYRYYEDYSGTFEQPAKEGRPDIEGLAWKLNELIHTVIQKAYVKSSENVPRKVILIAHSMGGLICRSMIAQVLKEDAEQYVAKVVTYGTPHAGIHLRKSLDFPWLAEQLHFRGIENFSHRRMFEYLNPQAKNDQGTTTSDVEYEPEFDLRTLWLFPPERFLCIVGTNHADYDVFNGYWKHAVGPGSDGLVRIENAWVRDTPRIDIHRSHSGRYGIVNSSEGYEEMQRFLFGEWRVTVDLVCGEPIDPGDGGDAHLLDVECSLGRHSIFLSSRKAEHLNAFDLTGNGARIHVFHLLKSDLEFDDEPEAGTKDQGGPWSFRLKLSLRLHHDRYEGEHGPLIFSDLLMEQPIEVRINPLEEPPRVSYRWANIFDWPMPGVIWQRAERQGTPYVIPIPPGRSENTWGSVALLYLTMDRWNEGEEDSTSFEEFLPKLNESLRTPKKRPQRRRNVDRSPVGAI